MSNGLMIFSAKSPWAFRIVSPATADEDRLRADEPRQARHDRLPSMRN